MIDILPILLLLMALFQKHLILNAQQLLLMLILSRQDRSSRLTHPIHDIPKRFRLPVFIC